MMLLERTMQEGYHHCSTCYMPPVYAIFPLEPYPCALLNAVAMHIIMISDPSLYSCLISYRSAPAPAIFFSSNSLVNSWSNC